MATPRREHPGFPRSRILAAAHSLSPGDATFTMDLYDRVAGRVDDGAFGHLMRMAFAAQCLPREADRTRGELEEGIDAFAELLLEWRERQAALDDLARRRIDG